MQLFRIAISLVLVLSFVVGQPVWADGHEKGEKWILITGATTGIGRDLAETLAGEGYSVYAGARTDEEMADLNAIENITAVRLDVTKQEQIDAAAAMIRESGTGLYALVNNAGIYDGGPVITTPVEVQSLVYDVNVEGVYRVTQAFAPLVVESKGRISTTGSIAGTLSGPGFTAYSGSKHWIEAFADGLAMEMAPLGVAVSVIEPGNYQTQIRRSAVKRAIGRSLADDEEMTPEQEAMYEATEARELSYKLPDEVTAAFKHALFSDEPLLRYVVVPTEEEQERTISTKVQQLVELNTWGPYSYSRDELVDMLDAALAKANDK